MTFSESSAGRVSDGADQRQIGDSLSARGFGRLPFDTAELLTIRSERLVADLGSDGVLEKVIESAQMLGDDYDERLRETTNDEAVTFTAKYVTSSPSKTGWALSGTRARSPCGSKAPGPRGVRMQTRRGATKLRFWRCNVAGHPATREGPVPDLGP